MANYAAEILDNGDGSFTINSIMRAPTSVTISGGTQLKPPRTEGDAVSNTTGNFRNIVEAFHDVATIAAADRSKHG